MMRCKEPTKASWPAASDRESIKRIDHSISDLASDGESIKRIDHPISYLARDLREDEEWEHRGVIV